jgi:hypothetical protein
LKLKIDEFASYDIADSNQFVEKILEISKFVKKFFFVFFQRFPMSFVNELAQNLQEFQFIKNYNSEFENKNYNRVFGSFEFDF